jgi:hypothetical protein
MQDLLTYSIIIGSIALVIYLIFKFSPSCRKYAKFVWIVIPVVVLILLIIISRKKSFSDKENNIADVLEDLDEKLDEAKLVSAIEVSAAKQKNSDKIEELKKVTAIKDDAERRRRLIDLGE